MSKAVVGSIAILLSPVLTTAMDELSKVIITEMGGETLCEVLVYAKCTVRGLKKEIEHITGAPVEEQHLTSGDVILGDDDALVSQIGTGTPLVVSMFVPQWTELEKRSYAYELDGKLLYGMGGRYLARCAEEQIINRAFATLPYHDADKADVLVDFATNVNHDDWTLAEMTMQEIAALPHAVQVDALRSLLHRNGMLLRYCGHVHGDRRLCMAAVGRDGDALEFVSQEMKGDRELCTAAVTQSGAALNYASNDLKNDEAFVLTAMKAYLGKRPWMKGDQSAMFWNALPERMQQNARARRAFGLSV